MGKNKDRLNQKSIPWADSILDQVMNLPPAGGEDLQSTAEAQTTAVEELMKMVNRKIAMNNGEGQYVWKKYECVAGGNVVLTIISNTQIQMSSNELDVSKISNETLNGLTGTLKSCPIIFTDTTVEIKNMATIDFTYPYTYDSATGIITLVSSSTTAIGTSGSGEITIEDSYNFIDYVVSSDTEAYPNEATHTDGYWYELVEEGLTGIDMGEITTSAEASTLSLPTILTGSPSAFLIYTKSGNGGEYKIGMFFATDHDVSAGYGVYGAYSTTSTYKIGNPVSRYVSYSNGELIVSGIGSNFGGSKTYKWVAVA